MRAAITLASRSLAVGAASLLAALLAVGCRSESARAQSGESQAGSRDVVVWHPLGSWSGRGDRQTESFTSETGTLRVRWQAKADNLGNPSDPGVFRVTAHSAISGRPLQQVVDERGPGSGVGYVSQDPHVFYIVVESSHLSWSISVEEGVAVQVSPKNGQ